MMGIDRRGTAKESEDYKKIKKGKFPSDYAYEYEKLTGNKVWSPFRYQILTGTLEHKHKGVGTGEISKRYDKSRYIFFLDAPFEVSAKCCAVMKKGPAKAFAKETGRHPMTAQMAEESFLRQSQWIKHGCNAFDTKNPISNPMSFWTEQDVLRYIKENNLKIASVYGDIVPDDGELDGQLSFADFGLMKDQRKLKTTGCKRTGCMFCGFGCHMEKPGEGRFEKMKITHPKLYEYIMKPKEEGGLDYKAVIDWINEHGDLHIKY